jgi:hypothetical protein
MDVIIDAPLCPALIPWGFGMVEVVEPFENVGHEASLRAFFRVPPIVEKDKVGRFGFLECDVFYQRLVLRRRRSTEIN